MPRQPEQLTFDHSGERQRRGDARHDANADEPQHFAHHHPHHLPLLRPKRHTNPYLPRSLRHGVRHHAIKSDHCKHRRQKTKHRREAGNHAFRNQRIVDLRFCGPQPVNRQVGIELSHLLAHCRHQQVWINRGPDVHRHTAQKMAPHVRDVGLLRNLVPQIGVLDVLHNADDFHVHARSRIASEPKMQTQGISPRKEFLRKLLIDHHRRGSPVIILRAFFDLVIVGHPEVPPCNNGHA